LLPEQWNILRVFGRALAGWVLPSEQHLVHNGDAAVNGPDMVDRLRFQVHKRQADGSRASDLDSFHDE
jgi:hypothetical protein